MGVTKSPQEEIIYLVSALDNVNQHQLQYVFYNGHGYHNFSECFNEEKDLDQIDWNTVSAKTWHDTLEDPDRKRRKQAELLVYNEVPITALTGVAVFNKSAADIVETLFTANNITLSLKIIPDWYY